MSDKVGAVMIVGSGISGMQAALDLADSGLKVYLVDNKSSIGGAMVKLDKTFPTMDCAMCTIGPRLVTISRHPNVEIITNAEVDKVNGSAGNFKVTVKKRARYIDEEKCTGCGECAQVCPVELPNEFDENLGKRKAIYRLFPQAVPNKFAIDKRNLSPCRSACPAGCDNQAYIALISQGKFKEALEVIRERIPLPAICGRTCNAPCEDICNRKEVDEALSIRALKRFAADYEMYNWFKEKETGKEAEKNHTKEVVQVPKKNKKVAVIGSGPAGLTVSYDLAKMGYQVVIFEASSVAGGMLRLGIPKFRLPPEVIDYEIDVIKEAGVEILTNTAIGPDMTLNELFNRGYESIFIAIGTHKSLTLNIEGENLDGVIHGVGFLQSVRTGREVDFKDKVVAVIGGGNIAIDSVRTALHLGAKEAFIIYRRSENELPIKREELLEAKSEGIKIHTLLAPTRILGDVEGRVIGVECMPMKLGSLDETGRPRPVPDETKEKVIIKADIAIPAIGQFPDLATLGIGMVKPELTAEEMPARWHIMPLEGANLEGVSGFTDFLQAVSLGKKVKVGEKILVVGGGNVALDVARTALRLGGQKVSVVCLEKKEDMPAHKIEMKEAEEEGIRILDSLGPKRIIGDDGKAIGLETLDCIRVFDEKGKFNPLLKQGTEKFIGADTIIVAIGQVVDYSLLKAADGVLLTERGLLKVDKTTFATNVPGIFAGGDVISGPGFVVDAIAQGHEAAISIDRYLRGEDLKKGREKLEKKLATLPERKIEHKPRVEVPKLSSEKRILGFDEIELGYNEEQAIAEAKRCLSCGGCSECLQCVEVCKLEAICHDMPAEELIEIDVGAIVLAPGYEIFDAAKKPELGYGRFPNVVNAIEFERILSASGPYSGEVRKPSDGSTPKRIAFIQCVGSRDFERDYCSAVCCMYATKEAILAKEHVGEGLKCDIFYIDMRAFSKGFEEYYNRAKSLGVNYIRCRPPTITEVPETKNLRIEYLTEHDRKLSGEYELVVLSTGLIPPRYASEIAEKFGLELNKYGFCLTQPFAPVSSPKEGIFVAGAFTGPKDIPESVMQGCAAAARSLSLLSAEKGKLVKGKVYPPERDVRGEEPRVGVFVCHCGNNIGGVIDVDDVAAYAKTLPNVVCAEHFLFTCATDSGEKIKQLIKEHNLNRTIVAACTPRTHETLFQSVVREAGLNPYLFEMANIRDQCTWVHTNEPEAALMKAKDLVRMAVAKARLLEPLYQKKVKINRDALVIGGGVSGIVSALELADQGFETYLIERSDALGGNLRRVKFLLNGDNPEEGLKLLLDRAQHHPKIRIYTSSQILNIEGSVGNFTTEFKHNGTVHSIKHGVVIVATGGQEYKPTEYLYGEDKRVMTQLELEEKLANGEFLKSKPRTVVMIQCVGFRNGSRPYCSRICCPQAVKNALKIREQSPDTHVFVLYRDMRTYGFSESYYTQAREKDVRFVVYDGDKRPAVERLDGQLKISVYDPIVDTNINLKADLLVLSTGVVPRDDARELAQKLKVPLTKDSFFLEAHMKLWPVDFATNGVFLCGLAHFPKTLDESIAQASAAASRASTIISKEEIEVEATISQVIDENCDGCAYCIDPCPFKAITLIEYMKDGVVKKTVEVDEILCKGCGVCQATCPKKGIFIRGFKLEQISAMIDAALGVA